MIRRALFATAHTRIECRNQRNIPDCENNKNILSDNKKMDEPTNREIRKIHVTRYEVQSYQSHTF